MNFRPAILALGIGISCCARHINAYAQSGDWHNYLVKFNNAPASILVDLTLINNTAMSQYPFVLVTGPRIDNCGLRGLPDSSGIAQMEEVLDATDTYLRGMGPKILAGTFTYQCERLNHYYLKDTSGIRNAISRLYRRNYPAFNYVIKLKHDPAWTVYNNILYPTEGMINEAENNEILEGMLQNGDSLTGLRTLQLGACFRSDSSRSQFCADLLAAGYSLSKKHDLKQGNDPYCVIAEISKTFVPDSVNATTATFKKMVADHNGLYLKWKCSNR